MTERTERDLEGEFLIGMLAAYSLLLAGLLTMVRRPALKKYYILGKTACSLAFLWVLAASGIRGGETEQFFLMLPAFLCCFAGDIFMAFYNRFRRKPQFLAGLCSFLAGHIAFVRWLCARQPLRWQDFCFPLAAVLLAVFLTNGNYLHTGRLRPYIALYTLFVALFFAKGTGFFLAQPGAGRLPVALGAALFFSSDVSILFLYFSRNKGPGIHVFNLATYYYGMFFLAVSLLF